MPICPGQNTMFWKPEDIFEVPCINCGKPIEFFKNDVKRTCSNCKQTMLNPRMDFACAEWCPKAEECLGPVIYGQLLEKMELERRRREHFEALLRIIPDEESEVRDLFKKLYEENKDPEKLIDFDRLKSVEDKELLEKATSYYSAFMRSRVDPSSG